VHKDQVVHLDQKKRQKEHLYQMMDGTDMRGKDKPVLTDLTTLSVEGICI